MVLGGISYVTVFLYKFQMSREGFCVNSGQFQPPAGDFSSPNTHSPAVIWSGAVPWLRALEFL